MRTEKWLSKLLRHTGNKTRDYKRKYRFYVTAYGLPMDSGCWFLWRDLLAVGKEAILPYRLPSRRTFSRPDVCDLASIGDIAKERLQFAVLFSTLLQRRFKTRYLNINTRQYVSFDE